MAVLIPDALHARLLAVLEGSTGGKSPSTIRMARSRPGERRRRKLLVSKRQLSKLWSASAREGMTVVPLRLVFNDRGMAKIVLGVTKGKNAADKRDTSARRDWGRQKARILKQGARE